MAIYCPYAHDAEFVRDLQIPFLGCMYILYRLVNCQEKKNISIHLSRFTKLKVMDCGLFYTAN